MLATRVKSGLWELWSNASEEQKRAMINDPVFISLIGHDIIAHDHVWPYLDSALETIRWIMEKTESIHPQLLAVFWKFAPETFFKSRIIAGQLWGKAYYEKVEYGYYSQGLSNNYWALRLRVAKSSSGIMKVSFDLDLTNINELKLTKKIIQADSNTSSGFQINGVTQTGTSDNQDPVTMTYDVSSYTGPHVISIYVSARNNSICEEHILKITLV